MLYIDENTDRPTLECAAIDLDLDLEAAEAASDAELLEMVRAAIEAGDECGG